MTAFLPAEHVRRATGDVARSALPDAPIRPFVPATVRGQRCRTTLGDLLVSLGRRVQPSASDPEREAREPAWRVPPCSDPHAAWDAAVLTSAEALHRWRGAAAADRPAAHLAYRAAAEREDAAARELARAARPSCRVGLALRRSSGR